MGPCGPLPSLLPHPCFTGLSRQHLGALIAELAGPWTAAHEGALRQRRGRARQRAAGAGPNLKLGLCDRILVTLVHLRFQLPHQALAVLYEVDRSTITRAIHEIRPLLAGRGFAVPGGLGLRLKTLADVFAYAAAWTQARAKQSSQRICIEHAIAEHKQWRSLQRYTGRRESYAQTHLAIAGLVSDRAARRR